MPQPANAVTPYDAIFQPQDYFHIHAPGEIFAGPARPLEVDLGCGDGSFLEEMAAMHPGRNFLGVERLVGRVGKTARRITRRGLTNARVLRLDIAYTVGWLLPDAGVSRMHLLCPDPWPKKKHHGRRIFCDGEFLAGLRRAIEPGGEFLFKSDDADYFEHATEIMDAHDAFTRAGWEDDQFPYARTGFERQWLGLGRTIQRARWVRKR